MTVKAVENLQKRDVRYEVPDPGCAGLYLQVHPSGAKSWCWRYRLGGRSRKLTIGTAYTDAGVEVIKIGDARDVADEARVLVAKRIDPAEQKKEERERSAKEAVAAKNTLRAITEKYLSQNTHLRSADHRTKVFERLVYPALGDKMIDKIKRSDIVKLLDEVAESRGPVMADRVLALIRGVMTWYAKRADDFASPIIRGMARTSTKERSRARVLGENELRAFWRAAGEAGVFGHFLRFTLLTATRRNEAARLRRSEIAGADWIIPATRYKSKIDHLVPLSSTAAGVLGELPATGKGNFAFATPDGKPIRGFGCRKEAFDKRMLAELRKIEGDDAVLPRWTIHDLRRTARTLLSQAGVTSDVAEACLGHVVRGVEGIYARYAFKEEKREAFEKLAALVVRIVSVSPRGTNSATSAVSLVAA
ncbi:integrase arm-type DNA-binding domain-containing protein [Bradyrhizobium sp. Arg68]|uniref:tyrosine-type recombinase/integrase n=1 Tax=Bradyrhizobium ivorense TaxID=2511166 RepID=UPI001E61B155|nr:site-specific integrase [Bradyrhizobium ivorense]MCC8935653.1 integrase arm-type DNA-binding domain-containing protein [Bradyrhizobium ivorense]